MGSLHLSSLMFSSQSCVFRKKVFKREAWKPHAGCQMGIIKYYKLKLFSKSLEGSFCGLLSCSDFTYGIHSANTGLWFSQVHAGFFLMQGFTALLEEGTVKKNLFTWQLHLRFLPGKAQQNPPLCRQPWLPGCWLTGWCTFMVQTEVLFLDAFPWFCFSGFMILGKI